MAKLFGLFLHVFIAKELRVENIIYIDSARKSNENLSRRVQYFLIDCEFHGEMKGRCRCIYHCHKLFTTCHSTVVCINCNVRTDVLNVCNVVFASTVILVLGFFRDPWPYFCSFQEMGCLLRRAEGSDFCCQLFTTAGLLKSDPNPTRRVR
jgi:hypothetical protein